MVVTKEFWHSQIIKLRYTAVSKKIRDELDIKILLLRYLLNKSLSSFFVKVQLKGSL